MHMWFPFPISFGYHLLICYTLFSVFFNHIMACLVHPGNLRGHRSDVELLKEKGLFNSQNSNKVLMRRHFKRIEPSLEMKHLMKYRFQELPSLKFDECTYICFKCRDIKLVRSHHCSV